MRGARFCLVTCGPGEEMRLLQAASAGCVPVVIQPNVLLPYQGEASDALLDWSLMAVLLQPSDIPNLRALLAVIPDETVTAMRTALAGEWSRLLWASPQMNPLQGKPSAVVERWAAKLASADVVASVLDLLGRRLRQPGEEGAGGATKEASAQRQEAEPATASATVGEAGGGALAFLSSSSSPSRCHPNCSAFGTCNEELGRCDCKVGSEGADCRDWAMPSCHMVPENPAGFIPCMFPSSCACTKECQKFSLAYTTHACFDERKDDGGVETDGYNIFGGPQATVTWNENGEEVERRRLGPDERGLLLPRDWSSPAACPDGCNGRGACFVGEGSANRHCRCAWIYSGPACKDPGQVPLRCFANCSSHGTCFDGVCQCRPPFFGIDCSLSLNNDGRPKALVRSPYSWAPNLPLPAPGSVFRPRIYVYELPFWMNAWQFQHSPWLDWPEQLLLLEGLLARGHRTGDPEEADFFYVPLMYRARPNKMAIIRLAFGYIARTWPKYWQRRGGRDHLILSNDDWGICEIGPEYGRPGTFFANITVLTLWGNTRSMHLTSHDPCFQRGKDIVLPPVMVGEVYKHMPAFREEGAPAKPRSTFLYFKGNNAREMQTYGEGKYTWSFGVRQKVFDVYEKAGLEGVKLVSTQPYAAVWDFLEDMATSVFCLAPAGWGWGMRATQAAMLGCIPVIIAPGVVQPYEGDLIKWEEFAVFLRFDEIDSMVEILRAMPAEVIAKKQAACAEVWPRFVWATPSVSPLAGYSEALRDKWAPVLAERDAIETLMEVLARRLDAAEDPSTRAASWLGGGAVEALSHEVRFGCSLDESVSAPIRERSRT
eukprot:TRINITY_DN11728_c0_g4_i1.p1 TRINITY_DN11728_c0_g4~~TRINITY_DN11728_c0_g4_i1.p1  ORF type:complete len:925 (-),score=228.51 TRINITY_DN11728_c0_g4_i1:1056-3536(-)